jgi:hypothetical protein
MKNINPALGVIICVLLGVIAYEGNQVVERTGKVEEAARVLMEAMECVDRCPPLSYAQGHDNEPYTKCSSACGGAAMQQYRQILKK